MRQQMIRSPLLGFRAVAGMSARQVFDGNLLSLGGELTVRFLQCLLLTLIWRSLDAAGLDLGMSSLSQLLTYTLMASIWSQQLNIVTPATSALWEGSIIGRYTRPMGVLSSLMAETIGRWWIPVFCLYGFPLWILSPVLGISPLPASLTGGIYAIISLALSASLGFALDFLFAAFAMRLKNGCWAATHVREAAHALFSGALIPFTLFPAGLGRVLELLPMGSIAHAPLAIYTGMAEPWQLIGLQVLWNSVLWPLALTVFHKSEERMISYGG